jgi:membrane associated rhomboid family serine protease
MVTTASLTHAPTTRLLLFASITSSILTSTLDLKHYAPLKITPHLWPYLQFSRLLTLQLSYTSATEVLVSAVLLYHFRVLERLWGSRKYASFVLVSWTCLTVLTPLAALSLKTVTLGWFNYVPAGAVGIVFAGLAAWTETVPKLYRYKVLTDTSAAVEDPSAKGVVFSDKSTAYLLAAQLALSQFPYQILPALLGWVVGSAYMGELLPAGLGQYRVPAWVVGESRAKERGQFEGLRRRLEEEGSRDGMRTVTSSGAGLREERTGAWARFTGYFTDS